MRINDFIPDLHFDYDVSVKGVITNLDKEAVMGPLVTGSGHAVLTLTRTGELPPLTIRLARLVAMAFIPNPQNKTEVRHLDGNMRRNTAKNLAWCDPKPRARRVQDVSAEETARINEQLFAILSRNNAGEAGVGKPRVNT